MLKRISFANFARLLLFLTGVTALLLLLQALWFLPVHDENVHTESAYIVSALRWGHGLQLYSDFRNTPYLITPFPPLWYALLLIAQHLGARSIDSLTLVARILSFTSMLAIALLLYKWNRRREFPVQISLCSSTFFLAMPLLIPMAVIARQDLPALLISMLSIFTVTSAPGSVFVGGAGAIAGLSFLTKHSSLAAPTSIGLWLLCARRWKHCVLFGFCWMLVVIPVMLFFQINSHHTMIMNLSGNKFGPFSLKNLHEILIHLMTVSGAQIMLLLFGFALLGVLQPGNTDDRLLKIYFAVSLPLALFACGFANATANHFLEPAMAWALLVPVSMNSLRQNWNDAPSDSVLISCLVLLLLLPSLDVQLWSTRNERPDDVRALQRLVAGKNVLSDVSYLAARSGNPQFLDPISLTFSEKVGAWSAQSIIDDIQSRKYELIVLHWSVDDPRWQTIRYARLSSAMRKAISANYGFCFEMESDFFYGPNTGRGKTDSVSCPSHDVEGQPLRR